MDAFDHFFKELEHFNEENRHQLIQMVSDSRCPYLNEKFNAQKDQDKNLNHTNSTITQFKNKRS